MLSRRTTVAMKSYNCISALFITIVRFQCQYSAGVKEGNSSYVTANIPVSEKTQNQLLGEALSRIQDLEKEVDSLKSSCQRNTQTDEIELPNQAPRGTRQLPEFIGFTAYLDHVISHLGIGQTIIYDKLLMNVGGAYSVTTGHFTCPVTGYYALSYYVYTIGVHQVVARMVINGVNQVDGISDTYHENHEAQGGNFVVLHLRTGDVVSIQNYRWADKEIDSSSSSRMSSFSGFLIR